jgi:hypothetical protein
MSPSHLRMVDPYCCCKATSQPRAGPAGLPVLAWECAATVQGTNRWVIRHAMDECIRIHVAHALHCYILRRNIIKSVGTKLTFKRLGLVNCQFRILAFSHTFVFFLEVGS